MVDGRNKKGVRHTYILSVQSPKCRCNKSTFELHGYMFNSSDLYYVDLCVISLLRITMTVLIPSRDLYDEISK